MPAQPGRKPQAIRRWPAAHETTNQQQAGPSQRARATKIKQNGMRVQAVRAGLAPPCLLARLCCAGGRASLAGRSLLLGVRGAALGGAQRLGHRRLLVHLGHLGGSLALRVARSWVGAAAQGRWQGGACVCACWSGVGSEQSRPPIPSTAPITPAKPSAPCHTSPELSFWPQSDRLQSNAPVPRPTTTTLAHRSSSAVADSTFPYPAA